MSKFLMERFQSFAAYVPGEQPQDRQYIKLNTNESPYPPAPEAVAALTAEEAERLRLYSDPDCAVLKQGLADFYGYKPENIFVSNGSDDILNFAIMAFAGGGTPAYFPDISYGFYPVFADLHGVRYTELPLKDDFTIDVADYKNRDGLIVIANPNAPTGVALSRAQVEEIVSSNPDNVVVIDEAYIDFGGESCVELCKKYDNLLVVMTYSKSRSMAGARLGFAIADAGLIADLDKIKYSTNPYNVNNLTLACGAAALRNPGYYREMCEKIIATREWTTAELRRLGFTVLPSATNFVFAARPGMDGGKYYGELKKRGILIRHFTKERIRQYNRISIGTDEEMAALISATREIIEGGYADENC